MNDVRRNCLARSSNNGWIFLPVVVIAEATGTYDRRWNMLLSLRSWALVGSSVMAIWTIRHPNMLVRWARRGFGVWSAWRLVKTTLKQQQLRG